MGNHRLWRKIAKRERRRRLRQKKAKEAALNFKEEKMERMTQPGYEKWMREEELFKEFDKEENERQNDEEHEKWLRAELIAQKQWKELQNKIQKAKLERHEQELRIKKEWELEQIKVREAEEKIRKESEEREKVKEDFRRRIEEFLNGDASPPVELLVNKETKPHCDPCPFFNKTGVCRFGDSCSRNHKYPGISKTLLAPNFFSYFGLEHASSNKKHENDISLEFDEDESNREFREFFFDVLPEFERWGKIVQFKVCNNFEKHLRGNVYVQFAELRSAVSAHRSLNARWYGGKQISLQFTNICDWNSALCGLHWRKKCPKGQNCNFLHVFRNPRNMFSIDFSRVEDSSQNDRRKQRSKEWRWSESPERSENRRSSHRRTKSPAQKEHRTNGRSESKRMSARKRRSKSRDNEKSKRRKKSDSRDKSHSGSDKNCSKRRRTRK